MTAAWLIVEDFAGGRHCAISFMDVPPKSWRESRRIALSDEESKLKLSVLRRLFDVDGIADEAKQQRHAKHLKTLEGIIRGSHHDGEIANAKVLWEKISGQAWTSG